MLAPKATLSAMMDDYLKFRPLRQGSPAGIEQYERTYQSLLSPLRHDAPRARDAVESASFDHPVGLPQDVSRYRNAKPLCRS
jgi:hypothetical protein